MTTHHDDPTPPNPYAEEAKERWGHTDAYRQSQERAKKLTKADWDRIGAETEAINTGLAAAMDAGKTPSDPDVQALVRRHYESLRYFYEPNLEMYRGLAEMYVADERFAAHYERYRPGLAAYLREAMHAFCAAQA